MSGTSEMLFEPLLRKEDVKAWLALDDDEQLYELVRVRQPDPLPAIRGVGKELKFSRAAVVAWLERRSSARERKDARQRTAPGTPRRGAVAGAR